MWTIPAGPFLSLFPRRWREALPFRDLIHWRAAAVVSGLAESVAALIALVYWYSYSVTGWAQDALMATMQAHPEARIPESTVGFAGLTLVALHPLTWIIAWFGIEGAIRLLGAAFSETVLGTMPLYALDRVFLLLARRSRAPN
jgi:hypothetical protein